MKNYTFIIVFLMTAVLFLSCENVEEATTVKNPSSDSSLPYEVKNGALHFSSSEAALDLFIRLGEMTDGERKEWEKNMGFQSMQTAAGLALDKINAASTKSEYLNLIDDHHDIIELKDNRLIRKEPIGNYPLICNREGIFYINDLIYKPTSTHLIVVLNRDKYTLDKLEQSPNLRAGSYEEEGYLVLKIASQVSDYSVSKQLHLCTGTQKTYEQVGKRRLFLEMTGLNFPRIESISTWPIITVTGFRNQTMVSIKMYGEKKNFWGNWTDYKTSLNFRNASFTIEAFVRTNSLQNQISTYNITQVTVNNWADTSDGDVEIFRSTRLVGDEIRNNNTARDFLPDVFMLQCEGSSRGIGDNWAEINCH